MISKPPPSIRTLSLAVAIVPVSLLLVARMLDPSASGLGTHHQLGLPPCSMRVWLGIRCPGCGMTTSWAHFTRGDWMQSMQVSVGGFLLAIASLFAIALALRVAWNGRYPSGETQRWMLVTLLGIMAVTVLDWVRRLMT